MNDRLGELFPVDNDPASGEVTDVSQVGHDEVEEPTGGVQVDVVGPPSHKSTKSKFGSIKKKACKKRPNKKNGDKVVIRVVKNVDEERSKLMQIFHSQVEELEQRIGSIPLATKQIQDMTEQVLTKGMSSEDEKKADKIIFSFINKTNKMVKSIKQELGQMKEETKALEIKETLLDKSDMRIRDCTYTALTMKFVEELRQYQESQRIYKLGLQKKLKRQIRIVQPNATDEEIERLVETESDRDTLYKTMILQPTSSLVSDRIMTAHNNVIEKHRVIAQIEQSVNMIHQMFLDLALLVEQQGGQLDNIKYRVEEAGDYIERGNEEIYESIKYSKKIRKKSRRILLIVAGVIIVMVVIVAM